MNRNIRELKEFKKQVKVAGLTGGIASGKSVATEALRAAGFTVIDADEISRRITAIGSQVERRIKDAFPSVAKDDCLDRRALRELISSDAAAKKKLDDITHPPIISEIERIVRATEPPMIICAPLLFETSLSALCDCTVCTVCALETRIERLCARDSVDRDAALRMINAQIPDCERAALSDFCVPSDGDMDEFKAETVALFRAIFSKR